VYKGETAPAVGEQSEITNADQAPGQNVNEEAAQKLLVRDGHDFLLTAMCIIFPAKGNPLILKGNQAMVGNGDAMGIAGEIVENVLGTTEGRLSVNHPLLAEKQPEKLAEATWVRKVLE
jgi:hypothetical protein